MPYIRFFSFMSTQKWRSKEKVARLPKKIPILMLSGLRDQVVPPTHMEELWDISQIRAPRKCKKWLWWTYETSVDSNEEGEPPTKDVFKTFPGGEHGEHSGKLPLFAYLQ